MKITDVEAAFGDREVATADEIVTALGLGSSNGAREQLARALKAEFAIVEQEVYVDGKKELAYVRDDFKSNGEGRIRGTLVLLNQKKLQVEAHREAHNVRTILKRIIEIGRGLQEYEPNARERERRLMAAVEYEYQLTHKWEDRWSRND